MCQSTSGTILFFSTWISYLFGARNILLTYFLYRYILALTPFFLDPKPIGTTKSVCRCPSSDKSVGKSNGLKPPTKPTLKGKTEAKATKSDTGETKAIVEINTPSYQARLGLARVLVRNNTVDVSTEIENLYNEVIKMAPQVHDAYIELGEILAKSKPKDAIDVYTKFPFSPGCSFDDAYLYGEIVRLLMKEEAFEDARLGPNMIALGKVLGLSALEKYVSIIESKFKYNALLRQVYAGVNGKDINDTDLQAFFKFKCWV